MNIRQVRQKIKSVSNVKKITNAMELVSTIKMKKAQMAAIEARPYQKSLEQIINDLTAKIDTKFSPLLKNEKAATVKQLTIMVSTNKGLCGAFNFNLFRFMLKSLKIEENDFIVVGKKAALFINKMGGNIIADFTAVSPISSVPAIFDLIIDSYLMKKYAEVNIFFNQYISTLVSTPTKLTLLPVLYKTEDEAVVQDIGEYTIEPDPKILINELLRSYVEEKIRNCIIQAEAGEHSSRMIAMKNATDNAEHVIYNLTLLRNKIRQEKITYELLDMMTAKESVES